MNSSFFVGNRAELKRRVDIHGPIVIAANGLLQRNSDVTFPFRQDSNFYYLTGINEPDITLVIDEASEYLVVPDRDFSRATFDGALDPKSLMAASGIREILDETAGWERLKDGINNAQELATLLASATYDRRHGLFANPARARLIRRLKRLKPKLEIIDVRRVLAEMRVIKQPAEVAAIQEAIEVTAGGIKNLASDLTSYKYEYEIEASLTASFRGAGANGHAFAPIVAGGKNACTLHNVANNSKLNPGELVVIDIGAEVDNYAADITRTLVMGEASDRQNQVYGAVLAAQKYALTLLKPGVDFVSYEQKVADFLGGELVELGLIKDASDQANVRKYCPHATSHFLGLDVHDVGNYLEPLKENMVLTCEPGIYIPEEGIGVRIEDDVLITKTGNRVLSSGLPRSL